MCIQIKHILLTFFLVCCFATTSFSWSGKVISVADGDTITVLRNSEKVKVRFYGIDCPEKGQAFGNKAKKAMNAIVNKKTVKIVPYDRDRYGRTVAVVYVNGFNVNESMIRQGYAWVYRKYCKTRFCADWLRYEKQARAGKKGLWADSHAMPPWEWRKKGRTTSSSKSAAVPGPYHGNVKSQVFHRTSCKHYNCKNCVKGFRNRREAIAAGYKPCGMCKP